MAVYQCLTCGIIFKCSFHGLCGDCELICFMKERMNYGYWPIPRIYGECVSSVCPACTEVLLKFMRRVFQIKEDSDGVP